MEIYIYMDYRTDRYEMNLYTFWDMIGIVGGVYEVLKITWSIFMLIYTEKLMLVDLVNSFNKTKVEHRNPISEVKRNINEDIRQDQSGKRFSNKATIESSIDSYSYCDLLSWCKKKRSKSKVQDKNILKQTISEKLNQEI